MSGGDPVVRTWGLTKRFGQVTAVDGVDLEVREGDVYGFLGANGSGKTTTVRMLLGLVLATSGRIEVLGEEMPASSRRVLPRVGALVEGPAAYGNLSGRRNLALFDAMASDGARSSRARRVEDALEQVGLAGVDRRPVRTYSLGMQQRLGLAGALLRRPQLLLLDEPTNGLDPQGIQEIRRLLLDLSAAGTTIFLSSHLLAEIEQMCSRVGVLDRGRLVLQDHLADLQQPTGHVEVGTPDVSRALDLLAGAVVGHDRERLLVRDDHPAAVNARLVGAGIRVTSIAAQVRRLEDVVLEATQTGSDGRPLDGGALTREPGGVAP